MFVVLAGRYAAKASSGLACSLREGIYEKVQTFAFSNIDSYSAAGLVTRMTTDVTNVHNACQMILRIAVRAPLMLICSMVMCFFISAKLSMIFLAAIVILAAALASGKVARYVTDFPNGKTANMPGCIAIPHLGASTEESEDNCAKMAVQELMDYLENGNIKNSVNYPNCDMGICRAEGRITLLHRNIPNSLGRFTAAIAGENINIDGLMNKSRGEYAYTMLDLDRHPSADVVEHLKQIDGVLKVRVIK